ncbi:hypothetical protein B0H17DRAFT_1126315 [Mycena rosella]|uniref:Uncharacterized protein n=1 Tax=Mycena rosella TaxID=1033263 RepID=A0AAD7GUK5_MYCRO|nr:hypothetical protein B0H17DRAFT_1126315 [Mycena rosella]
MSTTRAQNNYNPSRVRRGGGASRRSQRGGQGGGAGGQGGGQGGGRRGGRGGGRGGGRAGGGSGYTPYVSPTFSAQEKAYFYRSPAPDMNDKLTQPGLKSNHLYEHMRTIASNTQLATGLESLSLGDSDTGNGYHLSDAAVQALICAVPNLRVLSLDACTQLTDATLMMALARCPRLELVRLTGNDKVRGKVTPQCLKDIKTQASLAPALKELVLYNQTYELDKEAKALTATRSGLALKTGETLGDGIGANYLAAMTGGCDLKTYYRGKLAAVDVDEGLFGPDAYGFPDFGFF